jgi:hypothetical protein
MISRKTTVRLGKAYGYAFTYQESWQIYVVKEELYRFLYEKDYPAWFCNQAHRIEQYVITRMEGELISEYVMRIHTGEAIEELGQEILFSLARDILNYFYERSKEILDSDLSSRTTITYAQLQQLKKANEQKDWYISLARSLELDGYIHRYPDLLMPDQDALNVEQETHILKVLYTQLNLEHRDVAYHHLELTDEHYVAGKWDDSILNARKFLEQVLAEVANTHSIRSKQKSLAQGEYTKPFAIREYLQKSELMEEKEVETLAKVYGLLSTTGGHPYIADNDQARLMRNLALTFSQFALLRLEGYIKLDSA